MNWQVLLSSDVVQLHEQGCFLQQAVTGVNWESQVNVKWPLQHRGLEVMY